MGNLNLKIEQNIVARTNDLNPTENVKSKTSQKTRLVINIQRKLLRFRAPWRPKLRSSRKEVN